MRHDVPTEESQESAALYALGTLSRHEARAFEVHLRQGCEVCERELREFTAVVDALSAGAPETAPPAYLRDLLGARIEKESSLPVSANRSEAQVYPFPGRTTDRALATPTLESRSTLWTGWLPWAVAACLLIACAYSFINWRTDHRRLQAVTGEQTNTTQQVEDLREQLAQQDALTIELQQINAVLNSPQRSVIALAGLEAAPNASANIYWDHQQNRWVVSASLPPAPAGKVYQLWMVTTDAKISAGLIEPNPRGHGFVVVNVPANVGQMQAAAITLEPQGGSPQPTMPIYVMGKPNA
ncbi:MAG: anti-sigma factor domain-containing protein [Blastocatellia bacterium]